MNSIKSLLSVFVTGLSVGAILISPLCALASNYENILAKPLSSERQLNQFTIPTTIVLLQRKDWGITAAMTDRTCKHNTFGNYDRHKTTKLWWSKDNAGHGGSVWKVFDETSKSLEWKADADRYGDFTMGKHKGSTGTSIPFSQLSCR